MFPKIDYLAFMGRWSGSARYDLATSGIRPVSAAELEAPLGDDYGNHERFRSAVGRHYGLDAREVWPCLGTSGALFTAYGSLLERHDRVLVESPNYEPLWRMAEGLGHEIDFFERRAEAGFMIEVRAVLDALSSATRLVVVTNPHNPSAALTPDDTLVELAERLAERGAWLLVDEVYRESFEPRATVRKRHSRILACSSVTKCWGVPWARAGWLLLPEELAARAESVDRSTFGFAPPFAWGVGERALAESDRLIERARSIQAKKRAIVDAFVSSRSDLSWCAPPQQSAFGWLRHTEGRPLTDILNDAVERYGVLVAPGKYFGDESAFRLGWTSDEATLTAGLAALERALSTSAP